jgi:hypothetical protein
MIKQKRRPEERRSVPRVGRYPDYADFDTTVMARVCHQLIQSVSAHAKWYVSAFHAAAATNCGKPQSVNCNTNRFFMQWKRCPFRRPEDND